jgi:hypothetical protein
MGSIMCRKICSEFARSAQMVRLGISKIFYETREVDTQQKKRNLNFPLDLGFVCDKVPVTMLC